jgi:hypothetical protein
LRVQGKLSYEPLEIQIKKEKFSVSETKGHGVNILIQKWRNRKIAKRN